MYSNQNARFSVREVVSTSQLIGTSHDTDYDVMIYRNGYAVRHMGNLIDDLVHPHVKEFE